MSPDWKRLLDMAQKEVASTLASLPAHLRAKVGRLPVIYETRPNAALLGDDLDPDTLGLFVGPEFSDEGCSASPVPPQIMLFLENLWDQAACDVEFFREEVRTTFLHELGHYLGLDEEGLAERGLE